MTPQAERMLERLEGWLARLEADRRARDTDERGA
jgi:hypothetical protein